MSGNAARIYPEYRADINGLRGISILSVLIFHAFPSVLPGGFVGVDIFFVISGYLISLIVFRTVEQKVGFLDFYVHRARRLLPALLTVFSAVLIFGWFALTADELKLLSKHLSAAGAFFINYTLYKENGYFDGASELKPLLHLWSLSVEEQFYMLYPALILISCKSKLRIPWFLLIFGGGSFFASLIEPNPARSFFLLHTRIWELMLGGGVAYIKEYNLAGNHKFSINALFRCKSKEAASSEGNSVILDAMSVSGFVLILGSVVLLSKSNPFPGWFALPPVFGAALLLWAGANAFINRMLLSNQSIVIIGLISYPLYLWHWPIMSFMHIVEGEPPSLAMRFLGLLASFVLAGLTWAIIERPIRSRKGLGFDVGILLGLLFGFIVIGAIAKRHDGFPDRDIQKQYAASLPDSTHRRYFEYINNNYQPCDPRDLLNVSESHLGVKRCAQVRRAPPPDIAIIGDSHGEHLFVGLAENLKNSNVVYYAFRCLPFVGVTGDHQCQYMQQAINYILASSEIRIVVIAASWPGKLRDPRMHLADGTILSRGSAKFMKDGLFATIDVLTRANKKVMVVGDSPSYPFDPVKCVGPRPFSMRKESQCSISLEEYFKENSESWVSIQRVTAQFKNAEFYNVERTFCDEWQCSMKNGDLLLYRDNDHLSLEGSLLVGAGIAQKLRSLGWAN